MRTIKRSNSFGASLIELIVAVTVFSLVAAQCVQIFVSATQLSRRSADLSRAVLLAESAAEAYRSTGDARETADILGGYVLPDNAAHVVTKTAASSSSDITDLPPLPSSNTDIALPPLPSSPSDVAPSESPTPVEPVNPTAPPPIAIPYDFGFVVYYDADGKLVKNAQDATYILRGAINSTYKLYYCNIVVTLADDSEIFSIWAAGKEAVS